VAAVVQHHAVLAEHNAAIGIEILADVNVNAVGKLFDLRPEILRRDVLKQRQSGEND